MGQSQRTKQSRLKVSLFPSSWFWAAVPGMCQMLFGPLEARKGLVWVPKHRVWCPCMVMAVANCGKGLDSIKEGGNRAPEGTRATRKGQRAGGGPSSGSSRVVWGGRAGWAASVAVAQGPKAPLVGGRSQSRRAAAYAPRPPSRSLSPRGPKNRKGLPARPAWLSG